MLFKKPSIMRLYYRNVVIVLALLVLASCGGDSDDTVGDGGPSLTAAAKQGQQQFQQLCVDCHKVTDPNLSAGYTHDSLVTYLEGNMPLNDASQCRGTCAVNISYYIAESTPGFGQISSSSSSSSGSTGGFGVVRVPMGSVVAEPVAIRRLNRSEYNNTVRDLFFTDQRPADTFPEDDFGYGFNNIAKVLSVSLTHLEQYQAAAESLVEEAIARAAPSTERLFEAETLPGENLTVFPSVAGLLSGGATVSFEVDLPYAGDYTLKILAGQTAAGPDDAIMAISVNAIPVQQVSVSAPESAMAEYEVAVNLPPGPNKVVFEFTNDYWREGLADRNLFIDRITLVGPHALSGERVISCDITTGEPCASTVASNFAPRAWRRPITPLEHAGLLEIYRAGLAIANRPSDGINAMLQSVLLSPHFMFRAEIDTNITSQEAYPLNAYELAARLSYFLWGSMPDDALFNAASNGTLLDDQVLQEQVKRMLADPRSDNLIETFAVQWLKFDKVQQSHPDTTVYPSFGPGLVASMRVETRLFLKEWLNTNGRIADLVQANYTYLNGQLAAHYGVGTVTGDEWVRHEWSDNTRSGLLGHASLLTATSHPLSTSPVRRGKWVLDTLACKSPPPPPPGVENVEGIGDLSGLSARERFELHSDKSLVCYSCHALMDPIGFGLENFDPIGQWRDQEGDDPIDATGALPGGYEFNGVHELAGILGESTELPLCVTKHMMTYALGRGIKALDNNEEEEGADDPLVYQIYLNTLEDGHRIHDIITEIVLSKSFRNRYGAEAKGGISL